MTKTFITGWKTGKVLVFCKGNEQTGQPLRSLRKDTNPPYTFSPASEIALMVYKLNGGTESVKDGLGELGSDE